MRLQWLTVLLLVAASAAANETLDNDVVTRLVKAGLSADVIVLKIEQSEGRFDVSADGLIALKTAGVPDAVIKAMLLKSSAPAAAARVDAAPVAPVPPPVPQVVRPVESAAGHCASVRYYTNGNGGWDWYPASVCVTASAIAIDEQDVPLDQVVAHCSPHTPLIDIGGTSYRGTQEWWFTDGRELHKFRGKSEDIDGLISAVVRAHPASRHGSCGERDIARLLPRN
ncbi:MAG TPA: hypothetical protein VF713_03350 [Thermoanaerobaculia bacterium]